MNARTTPSAGHAVRGNFTNCLLFGFLGGFITAHLVPSFNLSLVATWTIMGLLLSLLFSNLSRHLTRMAKRRECDRAMSKLERRMDRLIPRRHLRAHRTHSHRPHGRDQHESTWLPVARNRRFPVQREKL